ncbi:hypothetical protein [Flexithrix dorotheae]|uniref:hypothetical protein n=1 Tax=Flexithrix dorotheae TaxID=70993 RepID=UPI0003757568|nr:hypothetical protein [Flexithrix dorotheae]
MENITKNIKLWWLILALGLCLGSCREDEAIEPSASLNIDQVYRIEGGQWIPSNGIILAGDCVVFRINHEAELLSIFPGDENHDFDKSALNMVGTNSDEIIYRPVRSSHTQFDIDFRRAVAEQKSPNALTFEGVIAEPIDDKDQVTYAYKINVNAGSQANMVITPENILGNADDETDSRTITINMRLDPNNTFDLANVYFFPEFNGIGLSEGALANIDNFFTINNLDGTGTPSTIANTAYFKATIDLGIFYEEWVAENGNPEEWKLTKLTTDFSFSESRPAPYESYSGGVYFKTLKVGQTYYGNFDTGFGIPITNNEGVEFWSYIYATPGVYEATAIATNVGDKVYNGSYEESRDIVNEYDVKRMFGKLQVTIGE